MKDLIIQTEYDENDDLDEENKSTSLATLSIPTSNYVMYKNYAFSIPNLSQEEEKKLALEYKTKNCLLSAQKLILSQLKTVIKTANEFNKYGFPEEDLVQEGNIGLMKAVKNYDPFKNIRLFSYAIIWIRAEMQSFIIKNYKLVKFATTSSLKKLFFGFKREQQKLIQEGVPSSEIPQAISEKLGVPIEEVYDADTFLNASDISIDYQNNDKDEEDGIIIPHYDTPEYLLENKEKEQALLAIKDLLVNLNEREQLVIENKFFIEQPKTNKELGGALGISSERVRQIEVNALTKLKKVIESKI